MCVFVCADAAALTSVGAARPQKLDRETRTMTVVIDTGASSASSLFRDLFRTRGWADSNKSLWDKWGDILSKNHLIQNVMEVGASRRGAAPLSCRGPPPINHHA